MERVTLGKTGLQVSRLGVGLSEIRTLDATEAAKVLNSALDHGINFLDTAACYGDSEELVGKTVASRRDEYALATKAGHVTGGYQGTPWTGQTVTDSIDRSLRRLQTDRLDLVQLHSCGVDVLERGDVIEALVKAREAGKTRFIGYSGDNDAARWAVESGLFDTLQTSFNLVDQHARTKLFPLVVQSGMGLIVKRPIANGAWGAASSPSSYASRYFERAQQMKDGPVPGAPDDRIKLALGFTLSHPEVHTAIVGTQNPAHMISNVRMIDEGVEVPQETLGELYRRFERNDSGWVQLE